MEFVSNNYDPLEINKFDSFLFYSSICFLEEYFKIFRKIDLCYSIFKHAFLLKIISNYKNISTLQTN